MTVMVPREKWTDERLDDLSAKVDRGFAETKAEMREGFARVDAEILGLRAEINGRFESLNRNLIVVSSAVIGLLGALVAALIGVAVF